MKLLCLALLLLPSSARGNEVPAFSPVEARAALAKVKRIAAAHPPRTIDPAKISTGAKVTVALGVATSVLGAGTYEVGGLIVRTIPAGVETIGVLLMGLLGRKLAAFVIMPGGVVLTTAGVLYIALMGGAQAADLEDRFVATADGLEEFLGLEEQQQLRLLYQSPKLTALLGLLAGGGVSEHKE